VDLEGFRGIKRDQEESRGLVCLGRSDKKRVDNTTVLARP
jgi:hypothetical protein